MLTGLAHEGPPMNDADEKAILEWAVNQVTSLLHSSDPVFLSVCLSVCMYVCMYVCVHMCMCV